MTISSRNSKNVSMFQCSVLLPWETGAPALFGVCLFYSLKEMEPKYFKQWCWKTTVYCHYSSSLEFNCPQGKDKGSVKYWSQTKLLNPSHSGFCYDAHFRIRQWWTAKASKAFNAPWIFNKKSFIIVWSHHFMAFLLVVLLPIGNLIFTHILWQWNCFFDQSDFSLGNHFF